MVNPTFGEKKANTDYVLVMEFMQLSLTLNKNKLFLFKHQMVLGSYQVAKLKQGKTIKKP